MTIPLVVLPFETFSQLNCGYCSLKKTPLPLTKVPPSEACLDLNPMHWTIGTEAIVMSCEDYERCMNMGFRRSGTFLYKGDMLRGCCRMYTIRTNLDYLKVTKEHRQVVNRFKRAIGNGEDTAAAKTFDLYSLLKAEQKSSRFRTQYDWPHVTPEKHALYVKYQTMIHHDNPDELTEAGFRRFLIDTPFTRDATMGDQDEWDVLDNWVKNWSPDGPRQKNKRVGPVHECYYLDEKLIALSVLDFLPNSLSSVYFIYDPDYANLSLGTLLGLREVLMCHELNIPYYYLGYYIDDCKKMRYKAKFGGEILDVCNGVYMPLEKVDPFLAGDKLWTLGNMVLGGGEPQLLLTGIPHFYDGEVRNASEDIYGCKTTYTTAEAALEELAEMCGCTKLDFRLPAVVPGTVPVSQVLEVLRTQKDFLFGVFSNETCERSRVTIDDLNADQRLKLVEMIRILGFELVRDRLEMFLLE